MGCYLSSCRTMRSIAFSCRSRRTHSWAFISFERRWSDPAILRLKRQGAAKGRGSEDGGKNGVTRGPHFAVLLSMAYELRAMTESKMW